MGKVLKFEKKNEPVSSGVEVDASVEPGDLIKGLTELYSNAEIDAIKAELDQLDEVGDDES